MPYGTLCEGQFCNLISTFSDSQTELEEVFFFSKRNIRAD